MVDEAFVLRASEKLDLAGTALLLCAGITTYSPLRHWKVGKGQKVGIVGLGGLGHMGVKFANAFGAEVVLFTTSPNKIEDGRRLGAHEVVVSKNAAEMKKHELSFDFILDTVSAEHDLNAYLELLKRDGTLTMVGAPENRCRSKSLACCRSGGRSLAPALVAPARPRRCSISAPSTTITSDVEVIRAQQINEAYERLLKSDVKYRFVIDVASLK